MPNLLKQTIAGSGKIHGITFGVTTRRALTGTAGALLFAGLIAVGANIRIPLQPVPITLQTLFVLLSGAVLGGGFGALGGAFYILLGIAGIPVFAGSLAGLAIFADPTGGYLIGFLFAPFIVGHLIRKHASTGWTIFVFSTASLFIIACGIVHLTLFYTHNLGVSIRVGFLPFILGDALKIVAVASIYKSYTAIVRYRSSR